MSGTDDDTQAEEPAEGVAGATAPPTPTGEPARLPHYQFLAPLPPLPPGVGIRSFVVPRREEQAPPQWAPDPSERHQWRWWNGIEWTDHVGDDGELGSDPLP